MRPSPVLAALVAGLALCLATGVAAQGNCDLLQSRSSTVQLTRDGFFNFISDPVFGCEGGVIIRADSAVLDDVSGHTRFVGNFEYRDSTAFMTADRADHFTSEGRLIGVGNVHIIDGTSGATFTGDSTVLVGSSSRREDGEMTILGLNGRRAHAVILVSPQAAPPDSPEAPPDSAATENDPTGVADSTEAPPDSAATERDPAEAADPTERPSDTVAAAGDSATAGDSAAAGDTTGAAAAVAAENREDSAAPTDSAAAGTDEEVGPDGEVAPDPEPSPPDTTPVPYDIDAERIYLSGADYMLATGNAELHNDEFRALADSIEYRETTGKLFLRGSAPRVFGYGAEYVLSGDEVDLDMDGNQVAARGDAALSGSEIDLTAPEIRVLMRDGVLDRIVAMNERPPETELPGPPDEGDSPPGDSAAAAVDADLRAESAELALGEAIPLGEEPAPGDADALRDTSGENGDSAAVLPPARPRALAETFELEGDSIDVLAPNEALERVVAVGDARGESLARDSLNTEDTPEIARSDWVSGDTIIAVFQPVAADTSAEAGAEPAAGEASGGYQLDRLVARGEAASLYRMTPSGGGGAEEGEGAGEGEEDVVAEPPRQAAAEEEAEGQVAEEAVAEDDVSGEPTEETATEADPGAPEPTGEAGGEEATAQPEPDNRLALHYVRGDLITIFMQDGEVTSVIVEGNAQGVQLEPLAPPPADTTATPDTTAAPPATRR